MTCSRLQYRYFVLLALTITVSLSNRAHSNGDVTQVLTSTSNSTEQTVGSGVESHSWGLGDSLQIDGVVVDGTTLTAVRIADLVAVVRRDIDGIATGQPCGLFAEQMEGGDRRVLKPDYTQDSVGENSVRCSLEDALMSTIINRGTLDTFSNRGSGPSNVERLDFIYENGLVTPLDVELLASTGHVIGEKQGNNPVQMAAIIGLDESGQPSSYGPLVKIDRVGRCVDEQRCYRNTEFVHNYSFFKTESLALQGVTQLVGRSVEPVTFAFVSLAHLSVPSGSVYYGVSVFGPDVNSTVHDLLSPDSFPTDTGDDAAGDSADLYGGSAGYYEPENATGSITGAAVCVVSGSGGGSTNVPLAGWGVALFADEDGNAVLNLPNDPQVAPFSGTGSRGEFSFSGLADNTYFVQLSPPAGSEFSTANNAEAVQTFTIGNGKPDPLEFALSRDCASFDEPPGPTAIDDERSTASPAELIIDVLTNDLDARGVVNAAGLELLSAAHGNAGTTALNGRAIIYTPGDEIIQQLLLSNNAADTFTYRITDESGQISQATVFVSFTRGPLDDPPDCAAQSGADCLFVETEIEGIGVGSSSLYMLILLFAAGVGNCAFRKKFPAQHRIYQTAGSNYGGRHSALVLGFTWIGLSGISMMVQISPVTAAATVASVGQPDEEVLAESEFNRRWYAGIGVGASELQPRPRQPDVLVVGERDDIGFHLSAGYDINRWFSAELFLSVLGEAGIDRVDSGSERINFDRITYAVADVSAIMYLVNSRQIMGYGNTAYTGWSGSLCRKGLSLYSRVGLGLMRNTSKTDSVEHGKNYRQHIGLGLGLEYAFANQFAVRGEWTGLDRDARYANVTLIKRFGKSQSSCQGKDTTVVYKDEPEKAAAEPDPLTNSNTTLTRPPVPPTVYFGFDEDLPAAASAALLTQFARQISNSHWRVALNGHTDGTGSNSYNINLSQRRVQRIYQQLLSYGIPASRLVFDSHGETKPASDNATKQGRANNRRVTLDLVS